jgi:hypothetical protein
MNDNGLIYKNSLPVYFYIFRVCVIGVALPLLFLARNDLAVFLIIAFGAFRFTMNDAHSVLEVYPDKFVVSMPSLYGKRFENRKVYHYDQVTEMEYFEKEVNAKTILVGLISGSLRQLRSSGFSQPPVLRFWYQEIHEEPQHINYVFRENNKELISGLMLIEEKYNRFISEHSARRS